ncbi:MAG: HAD hydrolase-like protein [Prevotella sp.]|nr:HAD hydrolase-like protein [Prevotella sp.]
MNEIKEYLNKHGFEALRPKAVLFDMDGVLYDSMPNHAIAWQLSMEKFGIHMTKADAYATEGARGVDTIRMMVKTQQGRDIDEAEAQTMYNEKTRQFHALPETPVMPGIMDLMAQIKSDGLTIGVVTGSGQRPLINRLIKDFGSYLDENHIVTAYDVKRGKPAPEPYLMGLKKVGGINPWEAFIVENAPLGIKAGVTAQVFTIAVNTGPLPDEALLNEGANLLFPRMTVLSQHWKDLFTQCR